MLFGQELLPQREGFFLQRFRLHQFASRLGRPGNIIERGRYVRVIGDTELFAPYRLNFPRHRFGFSPLASVSQYYAEVSKRIRNIQVFEDGFPVTQPDGLSRTDLTDPHAYGAIDVIR